MPKVSSRYLLENIFDARQISTGRQWQPLRQGVDISPIYDAGPDSPQAAFIRYQAGASVPNHLHVGFEHILILAGSQQDGDTLYTRGMLVIHSPGTEHSIRSEGGCLALAIWQKPVEFNLENLVEREKDA